MPNQHQLPTIYAASVPLPSFPRTAAIRCTNAQFWFTGVWCQWRASNAMCFREVRRFWFSPLTCPRWFGTLHSSDAVVVCLVRAYSLWLATYAVFFFLLIERYFEIHGMGRSCPPAHLPAAFQVKRACSGALFVAYLVSCPYHWPEARSVDKLRCIWDDRPVS